MSTNNTRNVNKQVRYEECFKNHQVLTGGRVKDGCMGFLPSQSDAYTCDACSCHRSFHKRKVVVEESDGSSSSNSRVLEVRYEECCKNRRMESYSPKDGCMEFWAREEKDAAAGSRAALMCAACG